MNQETLKNEKLKAKEFISKILAEKESVSERFNKISKDNQELLTNIRDQGLSYTDMMDVLRSVQQEYSNLDVKYFAEKMNEYAYLSDNPFFARIDLTSENKDEVEAFYISKYGFFENGKPILIDWRTKLASIYYKNRFPRKNVSYTVGSETFTYDLNLKRTYEIDKGDVVKYFDNDIGVSENELVIDKTKTRTGGVLEDIVETIQESQIEIIEADPRQVCLVQGCVGSGKSTVAIHKLSHIFFNFGNLIKPDRSILISKSRVLVDYLSTLFPRLGIFDLRYKTVRDIMFKILTQDTPKVKFNLDLNQDLGGLDLNFYNELNKKINNSKKIAFEEFSEIVNNGMNSETSYYIFNPRLAIKKQVNEIVSDLDDAIKYLKEDIKELKGNDFEIEKKKLTVTRILEIKKKIRSIESNVIGKSFRELIRSYSLPQVLGYRDALIFIYAFIEYYGISDNEMLDYCVIDEAQDFSILEMSLITKFVINNRFCIIGDLNQNIHNNPLSSWEEIMPVFKDTKISTFQLDTNYRSTKNIIEYANNILKPFTSNYLPKSIEKVGPMVREIEEISVEKFRELIRQDYKSLEKSIGVIFYEFDHYEKYISVLKEEISDSERLIELSDNTKAIYAPRAIYVTDFKHCKGLEFNKVYVFGFNKKVQNFEIAKKFFVAATRAMNELIILWN